MATGGMKFVQIAVKKEDTGEQYLAWIPAEDARLLSSDTTDDDTKLAMYQDILRQAEIQAKGFCSNSSSSTQSTEQLPQNIPIESSDDNNENNNGINMHQTDKMDNKRNDKLNNNTTTNNDQMNASVHCWTEKEEQLLISLRTEMEEEFNKNKQHETLWNKICSDMRKKGISLRPNQIVNKWKNLKKRYKEIVDQNSKTGNGSTYWKHYETFNNLYGNKSSTKPTAVIDTGKANNVQDQQDSNGDLPKISIAKKQKTSHKTKVDKVVASLESENKSIKDLLDKHHKDRCTRMDRFLDIFEKHVGGQKKD